MVSSPKSVAGRMFAVAVHHARRWTSAKDSAKARVRRWRHQCRPTSSEIVQEKASTLAPTRTNSMVWAAATLE